MNKYAKLFETETQGQILVKIDEGEGGHPEVRFYFSPENLGVCSIACSYHEEEGAWDAAQRFFDSIDEQSALAAIGGIVEKMGLGE